MARLFALVPAAGDGTRFGATVPKQYASIAGTPMLTRTLSRLREGLSLTATFVALADDDPHFERVAGRPADVIALRCGGVTRAVTVGNALVAIADHCRDDDWLLVHDAARPRDALRWLSEHLRDDDVGGLLAIPVADTLKRRLVRGSLANLKVTLPDDLALAEAILAAQAMEQNSR